MAICYEIYNDRFRITYRYLIKFNLEKEKKMQLKNCVTLFVTTCFCIGMFFVSGCSHPLTITNLNSYRAFGMTSLDRPISIGLNVDATEPEERRLMNGVATALGAYSAQVIMPYQLNSQRKVNVIAHVDMTTKHEGSGWNFLINWPGFLIFTPAWHGYDYKVRYNINCTLTNAANREKISQFSLPINLNVRHADIDRTWTELSWLEVSAIAFVSGIYFIRYNNSVTPLVSEKVENPIGRYIAQQIVKRINASGEFSYIYEKDHPHSLPTS